MEILFANESHILGMIDLLRQVGEVHHQIRPDIFRTGALKYTEKDLAELLQDKSRPIFVAVEENEVLGYCFCVHKDYENHPTFVNRKELYIDDLCVDENCRGSGVAAALYAYAREYGKAYGCDVITLNVWCGNGRAQRFYEKMGLTPRNVMMEMPL